MDAREMSVCKSQLVYDARCTLAMLASSFEVSVPPLVLTEEIGIGASDGRRILLNVKWFRRMSSIFSLTVVASRALLVAVIAHEFCHHLLGDAFAPSGNSHQRELWAD